MFQLPPLRERKDDILFLTDHFISHYNNELDKSIKGIDSNVQNLFHAYSWPGNVRELKHAIEYMMNVCEGDILTATFTDYVAKKFKTSPHVLDEDLSLREQLSKYETRLIEKAMRKANGSIRQAAKLLKIPRQTLQYKLKKKVPNNRQWDDSAEVYGKWT